MLARISRVQQLRALDFIARCVAPTGKAYGLDMTDEMLSLAEGKIATWMWRLDILQDPKRPGERVAVWDYENGDQKNTDRVESLGSRYANQEEERYAVAEARDDQGTMFHAGQEDLQAFWDFHQPQICRK
jgi:hypothetical protein